MLGVGRARLVAPMEPRQGRLCVHFCAEPDKPIETNRVVDQSVGRRRPPPSATTAYRHPRVDVAHRAGMHRENIAHNRRGLEIDVHSFDEIRPEPPSIATISCETLGCLAGGQRRMDGVPGVAFVSGQLQRRGAQRQRDIEQPVVAMPAGQEFRRIANLERVYRPRSRVARSCR